MLAEFLEGRGDWAQVMPGARACLFSLHDEPVSLPLRLEPLHFEALFCLAGSITLTRRDNTILTASVRQVLLLTDLSDLSGASVDAPLAGILVAVEHRAGAALDGQPGRLCRGGANRLEPGGLCQPGLSPPE